MYKEGIIYTVFTRLNKLDNRFRYKANYCHVVRLI